MFRKQKATKAGGTDNMLSYVTLAGAGLRSDEQGRQGWG